MVITDFFSAATIYQLYMEITLLIQSKLLLIDQQLLTESKTVKVAQALRL